ncbi:hypothetical protein BDW71DRAFT_207071 [Aspergillus fruticulosus]
MSNAAVPREISDHRREYHYVRIHGYTAMIGAGVGSYVAAGFAVVQSLIPAADMNNAVEFMENVGIPLASNPDNTVIGLVRNKSETEKEMTEEIPGRDNVHIIQGHLTDYASLQGSRLIHLFSYARRILLWRVRPYWSPRQEPYRPGRSYPPVKVNVIGNIHLFNVFIPLLQRGTVKVIAISTDQEALDIIPKLKIEVASVYAVSKSGLNTAVAKLAAQYGKEGILFMSVCPGMVDSGHFADGMSTFLMEEENANGLNVLVPEQM